MTEHLPPERELIPYRTADDVGSPTAFGTAYLVEMAKGAVDAAVGALHLQQREDTAPDPIAFLHEALEDSRQKAAQSRTAKMRAYHDGRASAFQIAIATLDLPQPDSPTRPSVSPGDNAKLTPSTACTVPTRRRNTPPRTG